MAIFFLSSDDFALAQSSFNICFEKFGRYGVCEAIRVIFLGAARLLKLRIRRIRRITLTNVSVKEVVVINQEGVAERAENDNGERCGVETGTNCKQRGTLSLIVRGPDFFLWSGIECQSSLDQFGEVDLRVVLQ